MKKRLTKQEAKYLAKRNGINFNDDFYLLSLEKVTYLANLGKLCGYKYNKKGKWYSLAFFQHLKKVNI